MTTVVSSTGLRLDAVVPTLILVLWAAIVLIGLLSVSSAAIKATTTGVESALVLQRTSQFLWSCSGHMSGPQNISL
jgi:hypothetical protein